MKKTRFIIVLLIFFILLTSCNRQKGNIYYNKALVEQKTDDIEEVRKNILLYMLTYNEKKDHDTRNDAVVLYTSFDFPASLNVALLSQTDCMEGIIALYKSYAELGQNKIANDLLESKIHGFLPTSAYAQLIVNYPTDSSYTISTLSSWYQNIKVDDKDTFLDLLLKFSSQNSISESSAKQAFSLSETLAKDDYYKNNNAKLAKVYKVSAILLEKLYDNYNSSRYWRQVRFLDPTDIDAGAKYNGQN